MRKNRPLGSWFAVMLCGIALALPVVSSQPAAAGELLIGAAASLTDALQVMAPAFAAQSGGKTTVRFSFGASSTIARQIETGAPLDAFLSADEANMDQLIVAHHIVAATRVPFATNTLVLVVKAPAGSSSSGLPIHQPADLTAAAVKRIALCDPAVPAGHYGHALLAALKLENQLKAKFVPAENVRAALALVESGAVDAGFVYATDAASAKTKVNVVYEAPRTLMPPIVYPAAVVLGSKHQEEAATWLTYLRSAPAQAVLHQFGFLPAAG